MGGVNTLLPASVGKFDRTIDANNSRGVVAFTLMPGSSASVTASGRWLTNPHGSGGWCGAGGNGVPAHGSYPMIDPAPEGCLVWEIKDQTIVTSNPRRGRFMSDDDILNLSDPGEYLFIANDDIYDDNQGSITIHVIMIGPP